MVRWRGAHLAQLVLVQHAVQLVARLTHAIAVVRVDHEDDALGILVVMAPQRADLVLAAHVCECEAGWSEAGKRGESDLQGGRVEGVACESTDCAPQTVNEMFLYSTVSTLKPIVGMVVTISPSLSL